MSLEKDKYRNPPMPLGYMKRKPEIVLKQKNVVGIDIDRLINLVIETGICDEPNLSIYEHFTINSGSEEEEVTEIPYVPSPKQIDIVNVEDDETPMSKMDVLIAIKKEDVTAEPSEDLEQESNSADVKISEETSPFNIKKEKISPVQKTDPCIIKKEKQSPDKKTKKRSHSKKMKERKDSCTTYDSDSNSGKRIKHKGKKDCESDSSHSKSRRKREKKHNSVSNSPNKIRSKRRESYDSENDSHTSRQKRRESYDSENNSQTSRHKRENYDSDNDSHKRRESYDSDKDSHLSQHKRRESYDSDNDSHTSRHKKRENTRDNSSNGKKVCKRSDSEKGIDSKSNSRIAIPKQDYLSDDSDYSNVRNVRRLHSPSPCSSRERTVRIIKQEEDPGLLYGEYPCDVCNVVTNSSATFESHLRGKRHKKNADARRATTKLATKAVSPTEVVSKYPRPPPGYYRVLQDWDAKIQPVLNAQLLTPSPGLDNVTEIQSATETSYYCALCNCACSLNCILPHLKGYKHQLFCLKHFKRKLYDMWSHKPKYLIEKELTNVLRDLEKKNGRGKVTVEKDYKVTDNPNAEFPSSSRRDTSMPSTSAVGNISEAYINYSIPDPSKSGYFCRLCNSHSNSEPMWQSHIVGKRHLTNVRKAPGSAPSKSKYIPAGRDVKPSLFDLLDRHNPNREPVVGLDQIREIQKPDIDGVTYNCFLCGCCISSMEIVDHILSRKHREKYLISINHPDVETLKSFNIPESFRESIIYDTCVVVERERGHGKPEVYYAKNAVLRG